MSLLATFLAFFKLILQELAFRSLESDNPKGQYAASECMGAMGS